MSLMALARPKKKARLVPHVVTSILKSGCPVLKLLRAFAIDNYKDNDNRPMVSSEHLRRLIGKQLHSLAATMTPYGTLVETMNVVKRDNTGVCEVLHINPFALLHFMAKTCGHFGDVLYRYLAHGARMVIYIDGVSPSDGLRFDHNRDFYAVYYTFLEFPS